MITIEGKDIFTTLEEMVNPRHTALVLIDMQNDYMSPGGHFDSREDCTALRKIIPAIKTVLVNARQYRCLVIHVQMTFYPNFLAQSPAALFKQLSRSGHMPDEENAAIQSYCLDGTWGWQVIDELVPLKNEVIVRKHRSSAFAGTDLDMILRSNNVQTVVFAGVVTHGCVLASVNDAPYFDYYAVLLRDCVASRSQTLHEAALFVLSHTRVVTDAREVIAIWRKNPSPGW